LQHIDLLGNLFCCLLRFLRQFFYFRSDDREPAAGLAGAGGLDGRVQRQQIRLSCDRRDQAQHMTYLRR
jgi:hypothetical protein